jgi:6-phosphogluconolactonase
MGNFDLRRFASAELLAQAAANDWVEQIASLQSEQDAVCVALSGGRIARDFLSDTAREVRARSLSLAKTHFFWSDERCVPPGDPESNFRLAKEHLFEPLKIAEEQIHRIQGERPPEEACAAAEAALRHQAVFARERQPVVDLVLLGMGEDGHVASLFPGETGEAIDKAAIFRSVRAAKPPPLRITMGYQTIAAARQVWVLASGAGKHGALRESLQPSGSTPLAKVIMLRASTRIYSDIRLDS